MAYIYCKTAVALEATNGLINQINALYEGTYNVKVWKPTWIRWFRFVDEPRLHKETDYYINYVLPAINHWKVAATVFNGALERGEVEVLLTTEEYHELLDYFDEVEDE